MGYAFLVTDSSIDEKDRNYIILEAIVMHLNDRRRKNIKTENFEGLLKTDNKCNLLGSFYGKRFSAELETSRGKSKLAFLVAEYINPSSN